MNKPAFETDVQGNILTGYGARYATYLFYRVDLAGEARQWLGALLSNITTEEAAQKLAVRGKEEKEKSPQSMLNIAVTFQGFVALGLSPTSVKTFPLEFREGMKRRAAVLCDFGDSDPKHWQTALGSRQVHLLIWVQGDTEAVCKEMREWVEGQIPKSNNESIGVTLLESVSASGLDDEKEHFGFRDNISQPWIEGTKPGAPIEPHGGKRILGGNGWQPLKLGEFVLGYQDEISRVAQPIRPDQLGTQRHLLGGA